MEINLEFNNYFYFLMGSLCEKDEGRSLIENFELYSDNYFIEYIQKNILKDNENDRKNSSTNRELHENNKLNSPINYFEDTLLHYAVYQKRKELIQFLIHNGADPNKKNNRGVTPKQLAKKNGLEIYLQIIK